MKDWICGEKDDSLVFRNGRGSWGMGEMVSFVSWFGQMEFGDYFVYIHYFDNGNRKFEYRCFVILLMVNISLKTISEGFICHASSYCSVAMTWHYHIINLIS